MGDPDTLIVSWPSAASLAPKYFKSCYAMDLHQLAYNILRTLSILSELVGHTGQFTNGMRNFEGLVLQTLQNDTF